VRYSATHPAGTIVVDPDAKFLYLVIQSGYAIRYGIGVGREGFGWSGTAELARKARWPRWTPPAAMIRRQPNLAQYRNGMEPGPENPLGARALYLYQNGRDTLYRIHGTNEPNSIGQNVSSGCIRLLNHDVIDLFERVSIGSKVVVLRHAQTSDVKSARGPAVELDVR
jgi:lipoprotein-anchoring transpeptidase ErfK/SrfK